MKKESFRQIFLLLVFFCESVDAEKMSRGIRFDKKIGQSEAKKFAEKRYVEATSGIVKKFKCRLLDQSDMNWYFICRNLDEVPRLDTDGFVIIKKKDGAATVSLGG